MSIRSRRESPGPPRSGTGLARLCSALRLPILLVALGLVFAPMVDRSWLAIYILFVTVTGVGLLDLARTIRRHRHRSRSRGSGS
jgi:hypothetical protein